MDNQVLTWWTKRSLLSSGSGFSNRSGGATATYSQSGLTDLVWQSQRLVFEWWVFIPLGPLLRGLPVPWLFLSFLRQFVDQLALPKTLCELSELDYIFLVGLRDWVCGRLLSIVRAAFWAESEQPWLEHSRLFKTFKLHLLLLEVCLLDG